MTRLPAAQQGDEGWPDCGWALGWEGAGLLTRLMARPIVLASGLARLASLLTSPKLILSALAGSTSVLSPSFTSAGPGWASTPAEPERPLEAATSAGLDASVEAYRTRNRAVASESTSFVVGGAAEKGKCLVGAGMSDLVVWLAIDRPRGELENERAKAEGDAKGEERAAGAFKASAAHCSGLLTLLAILGVVGRLGRGR